MADYDESMDKYVKNEKEVRQLINTLTFEQCVTFAATCCERLVPNYQAFSVVHKWGDPSLLFEALEFVWNVLKTGIPSPVEANRLLSTIESITPEPENFQSIYVMQALMAIQGVSDLLNYMLSQDKEYVLNVMTLASDAIYQFIQDVMFPMDVFAIPSNKTNELYTWAYTAPILITELADQRKTVETLLEQRPQSADFLNELRQKAQSSGINPVRRGLIVLRTK